MASVDSWVMQCRQEKEEEVERGTREKRLVRKVLASEYESKESKENEEVVYDDKEKEEIKCRESRRTEEEGSKGARERGSGEG